MDKESKQLRANIPESLHRDIRLLVAGTGGTIRAVVITALTEYLARESINAQR